MIASQSRGEGNERLEKDRLDDISNCSGKAAILWTIGVRVYVEHTDRDPETI